MKNIIWKITALLLVILLTFAVLTGCSGKKKTDENEQQGEQQEGLVVQRTISPILNSDEPAIIPEKDKVDPQQTPEVEPTGLETAPEGTVAIAYVTGNDVNVRKGPSSEGEIITKLALNTVVFVSNKDAGNDWSELIFDGEKAYIAAHYIKVFVEGTEVKTDGQAIVNGTDINLRSEATTDSEVLGKVSEGEKLDVLKKDAGGEWTMVLSENRVVFIATKYVTFE